MKYLFTPWRWEYIKRAMKGEEGCVFCLAQQKSDEEAFILYRGKYNLIIMNIYPYNNGHIMIAPLQHLASPEQAPAELLTEIGVLLQASLRALRRIFSPHGFNVGMNLGRSAGAGVEEHFHLHVVPRWEGDSNYMAVFSDTKVMALDVAQVYRMLKPVLLEEIKNLTKSD